MRGQGKYCLALGFQHFTVDPVTWMRWSPDRCAQHFEAFLVYQASGSGKYTKPSDAGKKSKPGQKQQSNLPEADYFSPLHVQDEKEDDRPESKSRQDDGPALKAPLTPLKLTKATKKSWIATKSINPHCVHSKLYTLVHKKDKSGYPASVKRCEECKVVFTSSDVIVVKTTAMHEFTDPTGKQ